MEMFDLKGKNAVVIGGSKGLGQGIAEGLSRAGAHVIIGGRNRADLARAEEEIAKQSGIPVTAVPVDICSLRNIENYVTSCVDLVGNIDVLVNCAGVNVRKTALEFTEEDWDQVTNTQLKYVFFMCQAVARHMCAKNIRGKIINIGSLTSTLGLKNMVAYCASKGGIVQVTKALANELAENGICVNAIGPGYYETEMTRPLFQNPEYVKRFQERIPMKRTGLPRDLMGVAVFLASQASDYMTGQILYVDGGWLIN
jgi:NAD(P)-dependent dehydrogenase (short-subunit alcohol dehydrogenase family)